MNDLETNLVSSLMQLIKENDKEVVELCLMILCNLSRETKGCEKILQKGEKYPGFLACQLVDLFAFKDASSPDPYSLIATILMNITQVQLFELLAWSECVD